MSFAELGLSAELLRAVAEQGYVTPTPIQQQAIPAILARRDIMGSAQTGTGKTAAFTLPMLQLFAPQASTSPSPARHPIRALILAPTRELAQQVEESVRTYGKFIPLRTAIVYGGVNIDPQIKQLHAGVEILVATPGRLLDHVHQRTVNLSRVEILVLDEADRMLDMGFLPDIKRILALLPPRRQNLLFSATFSDDIRGLADQLLNAPVRIEVARRNAAAETVTHVAYPVAEARKRALLSHLIKAKDMRQALVFTRTKHGANRLANQLLRDGIDATAIHSNKTQAAREQALADFKAGKVRVLVATDVAARGLDIEDLPHVINYELPYVAEDYVHRIGRTGRAGLSGEAISLVSPDEQKYLADIEKLLKRTITRESVADFDYDSAREPARGAPRREREPHSREAPAHRPGRTREHRAPARAAAPRTVAPDGFDFSKPYEPAAPVTADASAQLAAPQRRTHRARPQAALLGGLKKTP